MRNYKDHLILEGTPIREGLKKLNELARDAILFVVNEQRQLKGSLTDGDVRRGLIKGLTTESKVEEFTQANPRFIHKEDYTLEDIIKLRERNLKVVPVLNGNREIVNVVNFGYLKSYLPLDAVIMAGGKGKRLLPLTEKTPKPLLKIGDKPIMDYQLDRLSQYGVDDFWLSLNYLGEQIQEHYGNGQLRGINIEYIWEDAPMGTIGAVSKIKDFKHDCVLITNSDLLTTIDYEDFFLEFQNQDADFAVATIPYAVDVPYAVMETTNNHVISFKEKPTYTYYSNAGIYLVKRKSLELIPPETFYNSTDLMQALIQQGKRVISYPLRQYWLDIGKPEDFKKAQEDIKHLQF
ncbi:MAG: nucleotidyltransferase family protein [Bacteroidia bacterium]